MSTRMNDERYATPQIKMLSTSQIKEIHAASCFILENTGCDIHHEAARELLKQNGADVDGKRVYIKTWMIEKALRSAPSRVVIYNRDGEPKMFLGGNDTYFGTGSDTFYTFDPYTRERVRFNSKLVEQVALLSDALPNIDFIMSMGVPEDVPDSAFNQQQYAIMHKVSRKPQVVVTNTSQALQDVIDIAAAAVGGLDKLQRKPTFVLYTEPTSPLVNSQNAVDKLMMMAKNRLPTTYASACLGGGTCPVTFAGTLVQLNAECLAGLVIHQLTAEGAPFVYGYSGAPMDFKTMQPAYCSPETLTIHTAYCDIARYYGLPTWGFAGCSVSKICDEQAVAEAAFRIFSAALAGCNVNHDMGFMEFGLSCSMELLVIVDDYVRQVKKYMDGVKTDTNAMAVEAIQRVGVGGNFLIDDHTLENYKDCWVPDLTDRQSYEHWVSSGSKTMVDRANEKVKKILESHKPSPLPASAIEKIDAIVANAMNK